MPLPADPLCQDFWSVYGHKLGFLTSVNEKDIYIRTSTETRTFQVASGFLTGMDSATSAKSFPVTTQPSPVSRTPDSITSQSSSTAPAQRQRSSRMLMTRATVPQIDSIVPAYACPAADAIRNAYQSVPAWTDHLDANADLKARLDATLGTANRSDWASWCRLPSQCTSPRPHPRPWPRRPCSRPLRR